MKKSTSSGHNQRLHVTIGSCPSPDVVDLGASAVLTNDFQLMKSAILYADQVTLVSPMSNFLSRVCSTRTAMNGTSFSRQVAALAEFCKSAQLSAETQVILNACSQLAAKKHLSTQELVMTRKLTKQLQSTWREFESVGFGLSEGPLIKQCFGTIDAGMLDFHTFRDSSPMIPNSDVFSQFIERIQATLLDSSTYPLLDDNAGFLLSLQTHNGTLEIPDRGAQRARQLSMVAGLFEKLPQFELASMDEILDVRTDLSKYLDRFRAAIIKFSSNIVSAPWDPDFPYDAEQVFLSDVAPALKDIEDQTRINSYLSKLTNRYAQNPGSFAVPTLSLAISHLSGLSDILTLVLGIAPVAVNIADVFNEWKSAQARSAQNQMFFYFQAKQKLS